MSLTELPVLGEEPPPVWVDLTTFSVRSDAQIAVLSFASAIPEAKALRRCVRVAMTIEHAERVSRLIAEQLAGRAKSVERPSQ